MLRRSRVGPGAPFQLDLALAEMVLEPEPLGARPSRPALSWVQDVMAAASAADVSGPAASGGSSTCANTGPFEIHNFFSAVPTAPRGFGWLSWLIGQQGWLGEVDGLKVSLAGAQNKLTQID